MCEFYCRICGKDFKNLNLHLDMFGDFEHTSLYKIIQDCWDKTSHISEYKEKCFCGGIIKVNVYKNENKITWENSCESCGHVWSKSEYENIYE